MSYREQEQSRHQAAPLELYEFRRGVLSWRYTSGAEAVHYANQLYAPITLQRGSFEDGQEMGRANLTLRMMRDVDLVQAFIATLD